MIEIKTGTPYISFAFNNGKGQTKAMTGGVFDADYLAGKTWIWAGRRYATVEIYRGAVNVEQHRVTAISFADFKSVTFEDLWRMATA